jgi:CBS domain-containing membrane protein
MKRLKRRARITRYVIYKETLIDFKDHFWTFIGAFLGIGIIGFLHTYTVDAQDHLFLIGSFGASSVLIYGVTNSPLAQPRNLLGGHFFAALIGVTIQLYVPLPVWIQASFAVALSIVVMQITKTLHPPGGATALIAIIGSDKIKALGYGYVVSPVLSGVLILLIVAIICNNMTSSRSYPKNKTWFKFWKRYYGLKKT